MNSHHGPRAIPVSVLEEAMTYLRGGMTLKQVKSLLKRGERLRDELLKQYPKEFPKLMQRNKCGGPKSPGAPAGTETPHAKLPRKRGMGFRVLFDKRAAARLAEEQAKHDRIMQTQAGWPIKTWTDMTPVEQADIRAKVLAWRARGCHTRRRGVS